MANSTTEKLGALLTDALKAIGVVSDLADVSKDVLGAMKKLDAENESVDGTLPSQEILMKHIYSGALSDDQRKEALEVLTDFYYSDDNDYKLFGHGKPPKEGDSFSDLLVASQKLDERVEHVTTICKLLDLSVEDAKDLVFAFKKVREPDFALALVKR